MVGFVCVLCIGNYYRAKRASEKQKQRRLAKLSNIPGVVVDSPKSSKSSTTSGSDVDPERQHLLSRPAQQQNRRRNNNNNNHLEDTESLLFQVNDGQAANLLGV